MKRSWNVSVKVVGRRKYEGMGRRVWSETQRLGFISRERKKKLLIGVAKVLEIIESEDWEGSRDSI